MEDSRKNHMQKHDDKDDDEDDEEDDDDKPAFPTKVFAFFSFDSLLFLVF